MFYTGGWHVLEKFFTQGTPCCFLSDSPAKPASANSLAHDIFFLQISTK